VGKIACRESPLCPFQWKIHGVCEVPTSITCNIGVARKLISDPFSRPGHNALRRHTSSPMQTLTLNLTLEIAPQKASPFFFFSHTQDDSQTARTTLRRTTDLPSQVEDQGRVWLQTLCRLKVTHGQTKVLPSSDACSSLGFGVRLQPSGVRLYALQPEGLLEQPGIHVEDGHVLMERGEQ
jgi:hypothetical protein